MSDATPSPSPALLGTTTVPGSAHDGIVSDTRPDSSPWYGAPLGIALLAAGITVIATQGATALWRWRDRKLRRQGIIAAFAAEMRCGGDGASISAASRGRILRRETSCLGIFS